MVWSVAYCTGAVGTCIALSQPVFLGRRKSDGRTRGLIMEVAVDCPGKEHQISGTASFNRFIAYGKNISSLKSKKECEQRQE